MGLSCPRGWSRVAVLATLVMAAAACGRQDAYMPCNYQTPCTSSAPLCLADTTATHHTVLFCSRRCNTVAASSSECPGAGACVRLNGADPVCLAHCTATTDCDFPGALCTTIPESLGVRVCTAQP